MKIQFIRFLLVLNAFFISYAYGLNTCRVKVIDHSLPPVVVKPPATKPAPAVTKKPEAKPAAAKSTTTKPAVHSAPTTTGHAHKHAAHAAKKSAG